MSSRSFFWLASKVSILSTNVCKSAALDFPTQLPVGMFRSMRISSTLAPLSSRLLMNFSLVLEFCIN